MLQYMTVQYKSATQRSFTTAILPGKKDKKTRAAQLYSPFTLCLWWLSILMGIPEKSCGNDISTNSGRCSVIVRCIDILFKNWICKSYGKGTLRIYWFRQFWIIESANCGPRIKTSLNKAQCIPVLLFFFIIALSCWIGNRWLRNINCCISLRSTPYLNGSSNTCIVVRFCNAANTHASFHSFSKC